MLPTRLPCDPWSDAQVSSAADRTTRVGWTVADRTGPWRLILSSAVSTRHAAARRARCRNATEPAEATASERRRSSRHDRRRYVGPSAGRRRRLAITAHTTEHVAGVRPHDHVADAFHVGAHLLDA